jgi:hypothetical protein
MPPIKDSSIVVTALLAIFVSFPIKASEKEEHLEGFQEQSFTYSHSSPRDSKPTLFYKITKRTKKTNSQQLPPITLIASESNDQKQGAVWTVSGIIDQGFDSKQARKSGNVAHLEPNLENEEYAVPQKQLTVFSPKTPVTWTLKPITAQQKIAIQTSKATSMTHRFEPVLTLTSNKSKEDGQAQDYPVFVIGVDLKSPQLPIDANSYPYQGKKYSRWIVLLMNHPSQNLENISPIQILGSFFSSPPPYSKNHRQKLEWKFALHPEFLEFLAFMGKAGTTTPWTLGDCVCLSGLLFEASRSCLLPPQQTWLGWLKNASRWLMAPSAIAATALGLPGAAKFAIRTAFFPSFLPPLLYGPAKPSPKVSPIGQSFIEFKNKYKEDFSPDISILYERQGKKVNLHAQKIVLPSTVADPLNSKLAILSFHGNGYRGCEDLWLFMVENEKSYLRERMELQFWTFDYQGYGLSSGTASFENVIYDGMTLIKHVLDQTPSDMPITLMGTSIGGIVLMRSLIELNRENQKALTRTSGVYDLSRIKSIVLKNSFGSYTEMIKAKGDQIFGSTVSSCLSKYFAQDKWSAQPYLHELPQHWDVISFQNQDDPVVPLNLSLHLAEEIPAKKTIFVTTKQCEGSKKHLEMTSLACHKLNSFLQTSSGLSPNEEIQQEELYSEAINYRLFQRPEEKIEIRITHSAQ